MRGLGDGVGLAAASVGGGGAWPGFETTRRAAEQRSGPTGVEGTGRTTGPGRGAGGWRQGQGGPRDRPLRAVRLACGDLAGGPPPTGTHSGQAYRGRPCGADGERAGRRPPAHTAARPNKTEDPATGSLATRAAAEQCTGCTAIGTAADQRKQPTQTPAFTASQQHSQKSYEKYESFIGSS